MCAYTGSMEDINDIIFMGLNWNFFLQPSFRNLKKKDYTTEATVCNDIWDFNYLNLLCEPKCFYPVLNMYHKISE